MPTDKEMLEMMSDYEIQEKMLMWSQEIIMAQEEVERKSKKITAANAELLRRNQSDEIVRSA